MIGTSSLEYAWVVGWATILHSIAPLCITYSLVAIFLPVTWRLWTVLEYWAWTETLFYVFTCVYQKYYLQRLASHPPPLVKEEREKLFRLCFESSTDLPATLSKWFLGAPLDAIGRDNLKQWLRWAFLNTDTDDPLLEAEMESYVKQLEMRLGVDFRHGWTDVKSIRLTIDKVDFLHRSATWYACIFVVDILTHLYLQYHGFDFYRGSIAHSASILPPRPHAFVTASGSTEQNLSYWYHPHTSEKELPILFIHGIGVGLYPYMQFLKEVNQGRSPEDGQIGILAIEILAISSRITSPATRREDMCWQLRSILDHHGFDNFVLMSHSYGSVISTHLLKTPDLARRISSIILVDPISILLHQPDVVYNFTVRKPRFANEWLLWYFGSKDIGVAHTLARTFFWSQNILWRQDLLDHDTTVFLAGRDSIINAPKVRRYLLAEAEGDGDGEADAQHGFVNDGPDHNRYAAATKTNGKVVHSAEYEHNNNHRHSNGLKVVWCAQLDHGGAFDLRYWRGRLKDEVLAKCGGDVEVMSKEKGLTNGWVNE